MYELQDVLYFRKNFSDGVVRLARNKQALVVRISATRVTLAFKVVPTLINNCDRDRALFRFEGFRYCRDFNISNIEDHCFVIERGGLDAKR